MVLPWLPKGLSISVAFLYGKCIPGIQASQSGFSGLALLQIWRRDVSDFRFSRGVGEGF